MRPPLGTRAHRGRTTHHRRSIQHVKALGFEWLAKLDAQESNATHAPRSEQHHSPEGRMMACPQALNNVLETRQ